MANESPIVSAWLLDFIALIVALGWAATLVVSIVDRTFTQPAGVHLLMVGVSGSLFGFRFATRKDNGG